MGTLERPGGCLRRARGHRSAQKNCRSIICSWFWLQTCSCAKGCALPRLPCTLQRASPLQRQIPRSRSLQRLLAVMATSSSLISAFSQANAFFQSPGFTGLPPAQSENTRQALMDNLLNQIQLTGQQSGALSMDDTSRISTLLGSSGFSQDQRGQLMTACIHSSMTSSRGGSGTNGGQMQTLKNPLNYLTASDWAWIGIA